MIKIGLFGYGHLGKIHEKCLQETSFDLIGFHDPAFSDGIGTLQYYDQDKLMEACDACIIASTTTSHYCLLYTSPSPRDRTRSRMPSSA